MELEATVIFSDPPATVFVQDETGGTFFRLDNRVPPRPGERVRITGRSFPGLYLAGIEEAEFENLGRVGLPDPIPVNYEDLASGRVHYSLVVVEGIVRSVAPEGESASIVRLSLGSRVLEVLVDRPPGDDAPSVDSLVRATGLAAGRINDRRQLVEPYLRCRAWSSLAVVAAPPEDEAIPLVTPEQILTYDAAGRPRHRVRIAGTVLASFDSDRLFLRSEETETAIGVRLLHTAAPVAPGTRVEVIGFPQMEGIRAELVDARIVQVDETKSNSPEPREAEIDELFSETFDGELVSTRGTVVDHYPEGDLVVVSLRDGNRSLPTKLPPDVATPPLGATVAATGICRIEATRGEQYRALPAAVSLRLRDSDDWTILREPPWWTMEKLVVAFAIAVGLALAAVLWIAVLRRQVSRQTRALRDSIEKEAVLEERQRIAREFHDTMEQDLAGLGLRLDAASEKATDPKTADLIGASRQLVSRMQSESRSLLSDLRDAHSGPAVLGEALEDLLSEMPSDGSPELTLATEEFPPLEPKVVHHLKMIVREAVTNARRHAGAKTIAISARKGNGHLHLAIADDGKGIDTEGQTHGETGRFGCMGIRERAKRIGAVVDWTSPTEGGTVVSVSYPLPQ